MATVAQMVWNLMIFCQCLFVYCQKDNILRAVTPSWAASRIIKLSQEPGARSQEQGSEFTTVDNVHKSCVTFYCFPEMKRRVKVTDSRGIKIQGQKQSTENRIQELSIHIIYIYIWRERWRVAGGRGWIRSEFMQTAWKFTTIFMKPSGRPWTQLEQLYDSNTPEYPARKLEQKSGKEGLLGGDDRPRLGQKWMKWGLWRPVLQKKD